MPQLSVVKDMIRRLHELRHTEQVQRAYALNCGEGATVSYELQLRVLREFGLADGATELLQVKEDGIFRLGHLEWKKQKADRSHHIQTSWRVFYAYFISFSCIFSYRTHPSSFRMNGLEMKVQFWPSARWVVVE